MPNEFIQVKNQIIPSPVTIDNGGFVANAGIKVLNALIKETAMAALAQHTETKYPHATKNPAKSPKPLRE